MKFEIQIMHDWLSEKFNLFHIGWFTSCRNYINHEHGFVIVFALLGFQIQFVFFDKTNENEKL